MNVLATSDLHGYLPTVPKCDLLILGGDICPDFRPMGRHSYMDVVDKSGQMQARWLDTTFRDWLDGIPATKVVAIAGNHDFVFEKPFLVPKDLRWTYLEDEAATVCGLNIYGTPWVPGLTYWAFYGDERKLKLRADAVPKGTEILVTHGPPHLFGDFIGPSEKQRVKYNNHHGEHVGDTQINSAIMRVRPKLVVTGHIHEAYGVYDHTSGARVYNVALNDEAYNPINPIMRLPV